MNIVYFIILLPGRFLCLIIKIKRRVLMSIYRPLFYEHGQNFWFDPEGTYSFGNILVGDDVNLGIRPRLSAKCSKIVIGNKVMFGPEVTIMGGNHRTDLVGRFMSDVSDSDKRPEDDRGVVIEDDVWIGTQAVILHGVIIGRGSIVGAGAVVTKSVLPYSIVGGVPARLIKWRWTIEQILVHEKQLYAVKRRFSREDLIKWHVGE